MPYRSMLAPAVAAGGLALTLAGQPQAQSEAPRAPGTLAAGAQAELKNREGQVIGRARLADTPRGVLLTVNLERAPAGEHGFHVHEIGRCDPPAFESAGGHYNPGKLQHGFLDPKGAHAGDLPNIHVPKGGGLSLEYLVEGVTLSTGEARLLDQNGSALVLHDRPDDYRTDPSGSAGDRLACGVIQRP